jgi:arabinofuranosyltransferase
LIGYAAIYLPWILFCMLYFGQALPETLLAKRAQVILGDWTRYNIGLALEVAIDSIAQSLSVFIGLLILSSIGLSIAWVKQSRNFFHLPATAMIVALLLFGFGQSLFYSLIGVTFWPWYVTPLIFVWIVSGAFAGILLLRFLSVGGWIGKSSALVIIMSIGPAAFAFPAVLHNVKTVFKIESVNQHVFSYDPIVNYLHEQNPEGCCVATPEPGALGFKLGTRYKVVDELGLASPDVAKHIIEGDMDYPFNRWHPDYVIVTWPGKYNPQDRPWFAKSYALVNEFPHEYWQQHLKRGALLYKHKNTPGS